MASGQNTSQEHVLSTGSLSFSIGVVRYPGNNGQRKDLFSPESERPGSGAHQLASSEDLSLGITAVDTGEKEPLKEGWHGGTGTR